MARCSAVTAAACALLLSLAAGAQAAQTRVPVAHAARLAPRTSVIGGVDGARRMRVTLALRSPASRRLHALAAAVSAPGSPEYRRYLSVGQFARRFGASASVRGAVTRALRADGLRVIRTYADHLSITAAGSAAAVEHAFATQLADVRLPDGRRELVNTTPATLPQRFAGDVEAVDGLDGATVPTTSMRFRRSPVRDVTGGQARVPAAAATSPCTAATDATYATPTDPHFGYTSDLLADAYGLPALYATGDRGRGQTVAVYELERVDPGDLATFQSCYGTHAPVSERAVDKLGRVDAAPDGDGEATLDAEEIIGLAPRAHVLVYESSPNDADANSELLSAIASQDAAGTVSISNAVCENQLSRRAVAAETKLFEEMAVQGQSVFASSGDQGSEGCSPSAGRDSQSLVATDPASQPTVTAVGGTSLYAHSAAGPTTWRPGLSLIEGIWNSGTFPVVGAAATGGGLSRFWAMPRFQSTAAARLGVRGRFASTGRCGSTRCREIPDVSADGDEETGTVVYGNNSAFGHGSSAWGVAGGTSASAPIWAAIAALTDAQRSCHGRRVGDINPSLYALAGRGEGTYFRDITAPDAFTGLTSNNVTGAHPGVYPVTPGYDLATGLGSPQAGALAPALCARRAKRRAVSR